MTDYSRKFASVASDSASFGSTETQIIDIDLETNGYEGVQVELDIDSSDGTDDLLVYCYSSLDGTNWSDTAFYSFSVSSPSTATEQIGFVVKDFLHDRVQGAASDTNSTISVSASHQCWEWTDA